MYMHEDKKLVKATIKKVTYEADSTKLPLPMTMDEIQFRQKNTISNILGMIGYFVIYFILVCHVCG